MKVVRQNIFETNSSSTHVIAIIKNSDLQLPKKVRFDIGEYGWEYHVYYDVSDKAAYLMTLIYSIYNGSKEEVEERLDRLAGILESHDIQYSFPDIKWVEGDGWNHWDLDGRNYGYVDHSDEATEWLQDVLEHEDKLFRFLFDQRSYVSTGNDNSSSYYIPGIGSQDEYLDENYNLNSEYQEKLKQVEEEYELYYKGN